MILLVNVYHLVNVWLLFGDIGDIGFILILFIWALVSVFNVLFNDIFDKLIFDLFDIPCNDCLLPIEAIGDVDKCCYNFVDECIQ